MTFYSDLLYLPAGVGGGFGYISHYKKKRITWCEEFFKQWTVGMDTQLMSGVKIKWLMNSDHNGHLTKQKHNHLNFFFTIWICVWFCLNYNNYLDDTQAPWSGWEAKSGLLAISSFSLSQFVLHLVWFVPRFKIICKPPIGSYWITQTAMSCWVLQGCIWNLQTLEIKGVRLPDVR